MEDARAAGAAGAADAPLTAGERWTREQLELLLERRFSPLAIGGFLGASFQRSAEIAGERPALRRQSRTWILLGGAAWGLPAALGAQPFRRRIVPGLAWWAGTGLMLHWHLGMLETDGGRHRPLGPADALTLARAWLVPVVADSPAPAVLVAGALSDVLDGVAARRGEPTRAGRDLEGLVDACFSIAAMRGLLRAGTLGRGAALAEIARLSAGTAFAVVAYFGTARPPGPGVIDAGRATAAVRFAGALAASCSRRRTGDVLVICGCAASVAAAARSLRP